MTREYQGGNPVGYDAASVIAIFRQPCPVCGERLEVTRGTYDWVQRARIETVCRECGGEWIWFASPARPVPVVGIVAKKGVTQLSLFAEENT